MPALAYFCRLCGILFWLPESIISESDERWFNEVMYGKRISCPCCSSQHEVRRDSVNDLED